MTQSELTSCTIIAAKIAKETGCDAGWRCAAEMVDPDCWMGENYPQIGRHGTGPMSAVICTRPGCKEAAK